MMRGNVIIGLIGLLGWRVAAQNQTPTAPVDQLIPWLLDENNQLRGVPFSEVITDVTGKKLLPVRYQERSRPADSERN